MGFLEAVKALGLRCLSWAFYHATLDDRIKESIHKENGAFLDILQVIAPKYCQFEGVKDIEWKSLDTKTWQQALTNAEAEQKYAYNSK